MYVSPFRGIGIIQLLGDMLLSPKSPVYVAVILTSVEVLMYYRQVKALHHFGMYCPFTNNIGRLLKLVDRADLGSVGDEP